MYHIGTAENVNESMLGLDYTQTAIQTYNEVVDVIRYLQNVRSVSIENMEKMKAKIEYFRNVEEEEQAISEILATLHQIHKENEDYTKDAIHKALEESNKKMLETIEEHRPEQEQLKKLVDNIMIEIADMTRIIDAKTAFLHTTYNVIRKGV